MRPRPIVVDYGRPVTVELHPLTRGQREALNTYQSTSQPANYVLAYELPGTVDLDRLTAAVNRVLDEVQVYRRGVVSVNGAWNYVDDPDSAAPTVRNQVNDGHDADQFSDLVDGLSKERFRPGDAYLLRVSLIRGNPTVLMFVAAPFLLDRQSLVQTARAVADVYNGHDVSRYGSLPQRELLRAAAEYDQSDAAVVDRSFWRALLKDNTFEWRPPRTTAHDPQLLSAVSLDAATMERFSALCDDIGVPVGAGLLAASHFLLYRITGNTRIQTAFQSSDPARDERQLGCDEGLHIRVAEINPAWTVRDYLRRAARLVAYEDYHGRFPLSELVSEVRSAHPAFTRFTNVLFNGALRTPDALVLDGEAASLLRHVSDSAAGHDILFAIDQRDDGARITVRVQDRGDAPAVFAALHQFTTLIAHTAVDPDQSLATLNLYDQESRRERVDESWGEPLCAITPALTRILRHAHAHGAATAVVCGSQSLTFAQLLDQSAAVAASVRRAVAGRTEPLVGICMTRGIGMIVALLGTMRAGAGYVPLDPANPIERLHYILADSGAAALITDAASRDVARAAAGRIPALVFEEIPPDGAAFADPVIDPQSIAYVIYTSGTTGKPKGVVIEHRNLDTFSAAMSSVLNTSPGDRWLQFASLNFDASVLEIANCLPNGATLVVAPGDVRADPAALHAYLVEQAVTHAFIPPAMLKLLPLEPVPSLANIVVGGEATDPEAAAFWSRMATLWNAYGPTETTVACSAQRLRARKASDLGRPLPGYAMYLLDESGEPAPVGGIGEIFIAGGAVTRGYLHRPDLTESKFVTDPFRGGRMYATGDLARRLPDSGLEYIGRNDFQVKIRGYRIEIGDIETVIADVDGVGSCVVMPVAVGGDQQLAAWYTSPDVAPERVRSEIERVLPYYMVPGHLVRLDAFPVNIAGKVDRAQLTLPDATGSHTELSGIARTVAQVWSDALGVAVDSIALDTNFFHSGGHSLSASVACSRLSALLDNQIAPRLLFEAPRLGDFIDAVAGAEPTAPMPTLVHDSSCTRAPFETAIVRSIWTRAIQNGSDNAYTIFLRVEFDAGMRPHELRAALMDTLTANPIFSARVMERSGEVVIDADAGGPVNVRLRHADHTELGEIIERMRTIAFDVTTAPLWEAEIVTLDDHVELLFSINHIIFDGWSLNLLLEELHAHYEGALRQVRYERDRITAFDYGRWATDNLHGDREDESRAYWAAKLSGVQTRTALPSSAAVHRPESNRWIDVSIDAAAARSLREVAARLDATLSPALFAVVLVWLWRISNQRSLTVAYPYAGRDVPGAESVYGMFVKMGFLHETLDPTASFARLVQSVAAQMIDDREHFTATPYDVDLSASGVPNVIFSLQSGVSLEGQIDGHRYRAREYPSSTSKAELTAIFYEVESGALEGRLEFDSAVLDEALIRQFATMLSTIASGAGRCADHPLADLAYLDSAALTRYQELAVPDDIDAPPTTIVDVFAEQVRRVPGNIAIRFEDQSLTYAALDEASDRLAARLVNEFGVSNDQCVGISIVKSPALIIGVLGIIKAGGAYVALDTSYPAERLAYIIEDSKSLLIVADDTGRDVIAGLGVADVTFVDPLTPSGGVDVSLPASHGPNPYSLAYVIYTSGSTGKPKGVMVEHRTVPRLVAATSATLQFTDASRMVLMGTINFDASVLQMFLPLLTGGTLVVLPPNMERDPEALWTHLCEQEVTHTALTPALIRNLPQRPIPSLQALCFGGEEIDADSAAFWSRQTSLYSLYGPTETTVLCTAGQIHPGANHRILGRPVPGYRIYLLTGELQRTPVGCIGEIYIGGAGEARGYLGKPELSLERFMVDPFQSSPYNMMYRSGDLGRFDADGNIEFFGRNDSQIKLRGFRIELGEIETAIQNVDGVNDAAADVRGEGPTRAIVGYLTADSDLDDGELTRAVATTLPEYMIPTFWIRVQAIPRTANGKLDRKALPDPKRKGSSEDPPLAGRETEIAAVMGSVLNFSGIGRDDDFFKLGGNSLLVARLQSGLKSELGMDVSIAQLYAAPTVAGIAATDVEPVVSDAQRTVLAGLGFGVEPGVGPYPERIDTVLLTGAKGFLGVYLLAELLDRADRVICVLREADEESAWESLRVAAERASLTLDESRLRIVIGDLGSPRLGVDHEVWSQLARDVDAIVHCGAWVHHLYSYTTLKTTNVGSTVDLLELAVTGRRKYFTFVSTGSVGEVLKGVDRVTERVEDPVAHPPLSDNGYLVGKWVAEQLIAQAHDVLGLATVIARPGNITGDSQSGYSNFASNHFWLFVRGCLQLGACPRAPMPVEMTPVDQLARAISAVALDREPGMRVLNLANPRRVPMTDWIVSVADRLGIDVAIEEPGVWQQRLADLPDDNSLQQIRDFYTGDLAEAGVPVDSAQTTRVLRKLDALPDTEYEELTTRYVDYLRRAGFLDFTGSPAGP